MEQKIAVITGANGMDAKTLGRILLSKGYRIIYTYRRNTSFNKTKHQELFDEVYRNNIDYHQLELTDVSSIYECIKDITSKYGKIDEFYSLASQAQVGDSFKNPLFTLEATGQSLYSILDALRIYSPNAKILQANTSETFGGNPNKCPFNEKSNFECRSPYAVAKELSYRWCEYFKSTYGMFVCNAFSFNHSNEFRQTDYFTGKICYAAAAIKLGLQQNVKLGNLNFYRDETLADIICETFWKILQQDKPDNFVLGRELAFHAEDFLEMAFGYFGLNWRNYVKFDQSLLRPNEVNKLLSDCTKARYLLDYKPERVSFDDHIGQICQYHYSKLNQ